MMSVFSAQFVGDVLMKGVRPWIDVQAYGAKGDGTTDDTTAINSALAAVPSGGAIVFFSPGTYLISNSLNVTVSGTTLQGAGRNASIILASPSMAHTGLVQLGGVAPAATLSDIGVFDLQFKGQWTTGPGLPGLLSRSASSYAIDHVWVARCRFLNTTKGVSLGIFFASTPNFIWITDNYFENVGCQLSAPTDTVIRGNQILSSYDVAISVGASGSTPAQRCLIDGNVSRRLASDPQGGSIEAGGCNYVTISNNQVFTSYGPGIKVWDQTLSVPSQHVIVRGNYVTGTGHNVDTSAGIMCTSAVNVYDLQIEGNTSTLNNGSGIYVALAQGVTIVGNLVFNNGVTGGANTPYGIYVGSVSSCTVDGNTVFDDRGGGALQLRGIFVDASVGDTVTKNVSIGTNKVWGNTAYQVFVSPNAIGPIDGGTLGVPAQATTATTGFPFISSMAGAPTGTPVAETGFVPLVYDTTNHKFWIYDTSTNAWRGIVLA